MSDELLLKHLRQAQAQLSSSCGLPIYDPTILGFMQKDALLPKNLVNVKDLESAGIKAQGPLKFYDALRQANGGLNKRRLAESAFNSWVDGKGGFDLAYLDKTFEYTVTLIKDENADELANAALLCADAVSLARSQSLTTLEKDLGLARKFGAQGRALAELREIALSKLKEQCPDNLPIALAGWSPELDLWLTEVSPKKQVKSVW